MDTFITFFQNKTILAILVSLIVFLIIVELTYLIVKRVNKKTETEENETVREQRVNTALEYETQGFEVEKREYEKKIIFLEEKIHELENEMDNFLVDVHASKMSTTNLTDSLEQIESKSAKISQIKDAVENSENTSDLTDIVDEVKKDNVLEHQNQQSRIEDEEMVNELDRAVDIISPDTSIHSDGETTLSDMLLEQGANVEMVQAQDIANKYVEENIEKPVVIDVEIPEELLSVKNVIIKKIENYAKQLIAIKADPNLKNEQLALMKQLVDAKRMLQEYKEIEKDYIEKQK